MSNEELIVLKDVTSLEVFSPGGTDKLIQIIRKKVMNIVPDVSTAKGRSEIASRAQKIRSSKVVVENARKAVKKDAKDIVDAIDAEGKIAREALDKMIIEVMEPLQTWRDNEAGRIVDLKERLNKFTYTFELFLHQDIQSIKGYIRWANEEEIDDSWQEFKEQAAAAKPIFIEALTTQLNKMIKEAEAEAELERLQKAEAERKQKEREEKIALDAAAAAEAETKAIAAKAKADAKKAEEDAAQAAAEAEVARLSAEAEKQAVIKRAEKDKSAAIEHEKQQKSEYVKREEEARKQAEADKKAAIEAERKKVADIKEAEEKAAAKKAANKKHRKAVNEAALKSFIDIGIGEETAKKVINAIHGNKINHITINY